MGQHPSYDEFLRAKAAIAPRFGGMQVDEATLNPALKSHTRRMVAWGLQGGMPSLFDLLDADQPENQKLRRTA
ncbi:hypothetical protein HYQ43_17245 [Paracoccus pantotrophus]|uniref:Uncharacterized protein n=1 Tax=Paracoccus pantotrophus TaxID=82367 RepID=A0A7H9BSB8_PARPN|nr:hypothetical protein [Paracoccus pantotrophus]QLH14257.1 hypothetical protein HYQ43_17245 [Paracoccus pantotrophus]